MYRLDSTVTSISPGSSNEHIDEIDFDKAARNTNYKFKLLRPPPPEEYQRQ